MFHMNWHRARNLALIITCLGLAACATSPPGVGKAVSWAKLKGWNQDSLAQAWPAFEQSCAVLSDRSEQWNQICARVKSLDTASDEQRRAFLYAVFIPHRVNPDPDNRDGLITGYYEPLLNGSRKRTARFRYAIYGKPDDLLEIDLGDVYPDLAGRRLRGRLDGKRVVPYYSREEIQHGNKPLKGKELLWVDDPVALFFLHIQGSGVVKLQDGTMVGVGYADQNGYPYKAIGAALVAENEIPADQLSLQSIRDWLRNNPDKAETLMNSNPSFVFFQLRDDVKQGPVGTLGVPLTSERSIAVDRKYISLGLPVWLETTVPEINQEELLPDDSDSSNSGKQKEEPFSHLVFAQDTGGAISGAARADLFWGRGQAAEEYAGRMKQPGKLYVLLPRVQEPGPIVANAH